MTRQRDRPTIITKRVPHKRLWVAWVDGRSVLGQYPSEAEARAAGAVMAEMQDIPRLCTLRDIDKARKERAEIEKQGKEQQCQPLNTATTSR